jgi:hypothetical protein
MVLCNNLLLLNWEKSSFFAFAKLADQFNQIHNQYNE